MSRLDAWSDRIKSLKPDWRAVRFALGLIAVAWVVDSLVDWAFFWPGKTFLEVLLTGLPPVEIYYRASLAFLLLLFAFSVPHFQRRAQESRAAFQESEARYRAFFEHGPDGVVVLDPDSGEIVEFNDKACAQLGYTREEFGRLSIMDIEALETPEETREHIRQVMEVGSADFKTQQRTKSGEVRDVHVRVQIIPAEGQIAYHTVWRDITDQRRMEQELIDSRDRLREFSGELERVREEERSRLARELHDEVGQALASLKMDLDALEKELSPGQEDLALRLRSMVEITLDSVARVNRMSSELRSPFLQILGLEEAVESEIWECVERRGMAVDLEMDLGDLDRDPVRDRAVYRILLESLANARAHAASKRITVRLQALDEHLVLEVTDDGVGITEDQIRDHRSFGLIGMEERATRVGGSLEIRRGPERGTRVCARIPVVPPTTEAP